MRGVFLWLMLPVALCAAPAPAPVGNVIFLHPDGASLASWMATRFVNVGPAGQLNWDRLPHLAIYDGRLVDALSASSNGAATTHAWGVRAEHQAFGFFEEGARSLSGYPGSLMLEAKAAGRAVGIVQTGAHYEPGTAVFLTSSPRRAEEADISAGLVASGADLMLGGGEGWFLPEGVAGRHGPGRRKDGRNLVEEARRAGYVVVFTRDELLAQPPGAGRKVLGLFAHDHTFNDRTEEELRAAQLPLYAEHAPTFAEMVDWALSALASHPGGFFLVAEEEATDNFANKNNATGLLEAHRRTDEAIGVAQKFLEAHPRTLLLAASDSNAGSLTLVGHRAGRMPADQPVPATDPNGAPVDGRDGTRTPPFLAQPDEAGNRLPFWIAWGSKDDTSGGVVVRAQGLNAERVRGNVDNVDLYRLMHLTLFGRELPR